MIFMKEIMKKTAEAGVAVGAITAYSAFLLQMWT
jgi:hypothetical protein